MLQGLCFYLAPSFPAFVCERGNEGKRKKKTGQKELDKVLGGAAVSAILCSTVFIRWALAQHVHVFSGSSCWSNVLSSILTKRLQHSCFHSSSFPAAHLHSGLCYHSKTWAYQLCFCSSKAFCSSTPHRCNEDVMDHFFFVSSFVIFNHLPVHSDVMFITLSS